MSKKKSVIHSFRRQRSLLENDLEEEETHDDYHATGNQFERFRGFLNSLADSNSNFVVAKFFF